MLLIVDLDLYKITYGVGKPLSRMGGYFRLGSQEPVQ